MSEGGKSAAEKKWEKNIDNQNLSQNNDDMVGTKLYYPIKSTRKNRQNPNTQIN